MARVGPKLALTRRRGAARSVRIGEPVLGRLICARLRSRSGPAPVVPHTIVGCLISPWVHRRYRPDGMLRPAVGIRIRSIRRRSATGTVGSGPATPDLGRGCGNRASRHRQPAVRPPVPAGPLSDRVSRRPDGRRRPGIDDGGRRSAVRLVVAGTGRTLDGLFTGLVVSALTFPIYRSMLNQFTQLFRALTEAQRTGAPPPNLNNIIVRPGPVDHRRGHPGRRCALPRVLPAVEGRHPRQADLRAAGRSGRSRAQPRTAELELDRHPGRRSGCCPA